MFIVGGDGMEALLYDGWYIYGSFAIEKSKFEQRFDGLYKYSSLTGHENATSAWKDLFDEWKEKGILN